MFWAAIGALPEKLRRGAIFVDATTTSVAGAGHPFAYFPEEHTDRLADEDTRRMVAEYDPTQELVLVLLKADHTSTYRVQVVSPQTEEPATIDLAPGRAEESSLHPEPPDIDTLMKWEAEGGCEAACPHRCWVEPDGHCPHGNPSWLLRLGLI